MLFSYNTLKQLANLPKEVTIEQVTKAINSIGFEVEEYNAFTNVNGIKFGKVLETSKNTNSDKLTICKIKFDDKDRIIQTAATNVVPGKVVVAFVPGSKVGNMTFEAKELKGVMSEGMLSSPVEFGIAEDLVRDENKAGIAFYEIEDLSLDPIKVLGLDDYIIDVTILSNRSDANSYYVMALELAAYFKTSVTLPTIKKGNINSNVKAINGDSKSLVMLEAKADFKISIEEQIFLAKNGVKSINDVVDLTNLTLLMTGQPTHAYDKQKVGSSFKATKFTGKVNILGNKEVELKDDLIIESDGKVVSVAGVIGLDATGSSISTQDFILEFGRFNIKDVRKATKAVKLNTSASSQSSKEIAAGTTLLALAYVSNKLNTFSQVINEVEAKVKHIKFDEKYIMMLAGSDISSDVRYTDTKKSLETLGFKFLNNEIEVPSYRHDIDHQQDMSEEIFRFYGYDHFKPQPTKVSPLKVENVRNIHKEVASAGYQEVVTYSLVSKVINNINPFGFKETISLETFISKEREEIRNSQAISLLQVIEYNQKRKIDDISIFDYGMINDGIKTLALASTTKSFEAIKKDLLNIISNDLVFARHTSKDLHPGVSASISLNNKVIGWIGKVHPSLTSINAFIAEVMLPERITTKTFIDYSNDPLKSRDITFALELKEELSSKLKDIESISGIFEVKVIDSFIKENLNKVTIRVYGTDKAIELIDSKYNINQ